MDEPVKCLCGCLVEDHHTGHCVFAGGPDGGCGCYGLQAAFRDMTRELSEARAKVERLEGEKFNLGADLAAKEADRAMYRRENARLRAALEKIHKRPLERDPADDANESRHLAYAALNPKPEPEGGTDGQ